MFLFDLDVLKSGSTISLKGLILGTLSDLTRLYGFFCASFNVQKSKNKKKNIIQNCSSYMSCTDQATPVHRGEGLNNKKSQSSLLSLDSVSASATVCVYTVLYLFKSNICDSIA